ncbi:putative HNH endonuclease [Sporosarcina phage Lietuvens]|nr:putative HNH endonuclease [Sporosarcina phage Lietuvens]
MMPLIKELIDVGCKEEVRGRGITCYIMKDFIIAKECTSCGVVRRLENFHKNPRGVGQRRSQCRDCKNGLTKSWRDKSADKISEYLDETRGRRIHTNASWKLRNKERVRKGKTKWARDNKGRRSISEQRRVAIKAKLPGECTPEQFNKTLMYFGNACALSGRDNALHSDHSIPISSGHGGTIRENMVPLDETLNTSKNDRHLFEWYEANRERFDLPRAKFDALVQWLADANEMTTQEYRKYVDWCFDNPRIIDEATGELVFRDGPINERSARKYNGK